MTSQQKAFLDMLAFSEGTKLVTNSDNGYNVLVGGTLFHSYADHPRQKVKVQDGLWSTAAGRYQLLARYFDAYKAQLKLTDFSPRSQDEIALQQIAECHALPDIEAGELQRAITKCAHIWASLPGNNYGQPQKTYSALTRAFVGAGGKLPPVDSAAQAV